MRRVVRAGAWIALLISACGGGEMTLTEYVDSLNAIVEQARQQYEELAASAESGVLAAEQDQLSEFTPQDLQAALVHVRQIEALVDEGTSAIDPPEQVAELHNLFFDFDSEFISAQEALAARAGTAVDWNELSNTPEMAGALAGLADSFVMDAFGSAHRSHASTVGVAERLPSAVGMLIANELTAFERVLDDPARPFVVLLGGAKVSDKLGVIRALLPKVDVMMVGGAMCFTILAAEGFEIGESLVERDMLDDVRDLLASEWGSRISLPIDIVVADRFASDAPHATHPASDLPTSGFGLDIGPETAERYGAMIAGADSIFWNGPMGVSEWDAFATGTRAVARAVTSSPAYSVAGGGDSVAALHRMGLAGGVDHLSTGGGAGLELIETGSLVAVEAVRRSRGT